MVPNKTIYKIVFAALVLAMPLTGQAATTWEFVDTDNCTSNGCGGWDDHRDYKDTAGSKTVTVKSYIAKNSEYIAPGQVNSWSGSGLGARKSGSDNSGSPWHALDNKNDEYEAILFDFGAGNLVSLNSVSIGWSSGDSDLSVMAMTGGVPEGDLTGLKWGELLTKGWDDIAKLSDLERWQNDTAAFNNVDDPVASRYWLIGAYNEKLHDSTSWSCPGGSCNKTAGWEAVKISAVSGNYAVPSSGNSVPEPTTLLLMGLGLAILGTRRMLTAS